MEDKSLSLWKIPLGVQGKNHNGNHEKHERFEKELKMGAHVEKEHTSNPNLAKKIAKDHLKEDPHYYTKLKKTFKHN